MIAILGSSSRRVRTRRLVTAAVVAGTVLATAIVPASAARPDRQGWWTSANLGLAASPMSPVPPDVPADGFEVRGSMSNVQSVAALYWAIPDGASVGSLQLKVAPNSMLLQGTALRACPLTSTQFQTSHGGPMSEAPRWDCSRSAPGTSDQDGQSFSFEVAGLVEGHHLAIAIVPAGNADRTAFAGADEGSLTLHQAARTESEVQDDVIASGEAATVPSTASSDPVADTSKDPMIQESGLAQTGETVVRPRVFDSPPILRPLSRSTRVDAGALVGAVVVVLMAVSGWRRGRRALTLAVGASATND